MADETALDTGIETEALDSGTDTSVVDTQETDAAEPTTLADPTKPLAGPYKAVTQNEKGQTVLDEKARALVEDLKTKDPALAKEVRNALFEVERFRKALPGGIGEVNELRQTVEQLGGEMGVRETLEEVNGWRGFDEQYMAGDPKAIEFMLSTPETQAAFVKLAPMVFDKFETLNPEAHSSYICQKISGDMLVSKIPIAMELTQHFLAVGDVVQAGQQFKKVLAWMQKIDSIASAPPPAKQAVPRADEDPRFKELQQRDTERTRDEWRRETAATQNQVYSAELNRLLDGRKINDIQRRNILADVQSGLSIAIKSNEKTLDQYFSVKDKAGFIKFSNSFSQKKIPELLRKAIDSFVPAKIGPKNGAPQGGPVRPSVNGVKPNAPAGMTFVAKQPSSSEIDWADPRTSIRQGRAVVGGKVVTWKR